MNSVGYVFNVPICRDFQHVVNVLHEKTQPLCVGLFDRRPTSADEIQTSGATVLAGAAGRRIAGFSPAKLTPNATPTTPPTASIFIQGRMPFSLWTQTNLLERLALSPSACEFSWSTFSTCSKSLEIGTLKTCPTKLIHKPKAPPRHPRARKLLSEIDPGELAA